MPIAAHPPLRQQVVQVREGLLTIEAISKAYLVNANKIVYLQSDQVK